MKLAYLITAYDNPNHLRKLIDALQSNDVYIFIHIDKKSQITISYPEAKNIIFLKDRITVFWGSHTFNEAVQKLIKKSFEFGPFDYYILLSGTDYPVRSNEYIKKFIEKNKDIQFINLSKMPSYNKSLDRVHYYYISEYDKSLNPLYISIRILNELIRRLKIKRQLPVKYRDMTLYGGSTWWGMSGDAIRYMMEFIEQNPQFVKFYKNTLIPEEMFVHTIIGNSPFMKKTLPSFTYADWPTDALAHPVNIGEKHIPVLKQEKVPSRYGKEAFVLFARKFSDKNPSITRLIDSNM